jgi:beta-lactamase superfamily II metal-dependent hydrolase
MFSVHIIQAEYGDCLLLEFGVEASRGFILIDGGPPMIFDTALRRVLEGRVKPQGGQLDRVIVSHVDNDHIVGLIDLLAELRAQRADGQPEMVSVLGLWHNSFTRALDPDNTLSPRLRTLLAVAGMETAMNCSAVSINGIAEGNKLRQFAQILEIPLNAGLPDPITVESASAPVSLRNLTLNVVGPTQANLEALRVEWNEWLDNHEEEIASGNLKVMANADKSVPNLSSICLVAEAEGRTILLTGDARSDHVLEGLAAKGLLDASGRVHFDVLKVPHHGSDRNITKTFFRKVTADRYVISADGKYGNPDLATLVWLVEAAKEQNRTPEIFITNRTQSTRKLVEEYPSSEYGYQLRFLPESDASMEVVLA